MKFQVFSQIDGEDPHVMDTPPHPGAFFDISLQGWVLEVRDLAHLLEMTREVPLLVGYPVDKDMPCITVMKE